MTRPYSLDVHHLLVSHRGQFEQGDLPVGDHARALDGVEDTATPLWNPSRRYNELQEVFKAAQQDGADDLRTYKLYIEGLGRIGQVDGMRRAWEELARNTKCRDRYRAEAGGECHFLGKKQS